MKVAVSLLLILLLASCGVIVKSSSSTRQQCPTWFNQDSGTLCDIKIFKDGFSYGKYIDFNGYDAIRLTIISSDVVVEDAENVIFKLDNGETIDHVTDRLYPATYIVEKKDTTLSGGFRLSNPHTDETVSISAEFIRVSAEE